jgi:hypothetical protein
MNTGVSGQVEAFSFWQGQAAILIAHSPRVQKETDHEPKIRRAGRNRRLTPDNRMQHREGVGSRY